MRVSMREGWQGLLGLMMLLVIFPMKDGRGEEKKGPFWPSNATSEASGLLGKKEGEILDVEEFRDPEACRKCHADQYHEWKGSMHANSWTDPIFQNAFSKAQEDTQGYTDKYCAACHAPISLVSGEFEGERPRVSWIGAQGVQCDFCHTVIGTNGVGNGGYISSPMGEVIMGILPDPKENSAHTSRYSKLHQTSEFCGTCHSSKSPLTGLPLETTYEEWTQSPFNSDDPEKAMNCQDCHMFQTPEYPSAGPVVRRRLNPGKAASLEDAPMREHVFTHWFAGGNALVTGIYNALTNQFLALERLKHAASLEVKGPEKAQAGQEVEIEVKVSNTGAGHKIPTGFAVGRQIWVKVIALDGKKRIFFTSGEQNEEQYVAPGAKFYRVRLGDEEGKETFRWWRASKVLEDTRLLPQKSDTTKYVFSIPPDVQGPVTCIVSLNYQTSRQEVIDFLMGKEGAPLVRAVKMAEERLEIPLR